MLADGTFFRDLGEGYLDSVRKARSKDHLVRRLEAMGFQVELKPSVAA
jgi:hypothetical protein